MIPEKARKKKQLDMLREGIWSTPCPPLMLQGYADIIARYSADYVERGINLLWTYHPDHRQGPPVLEKHIRQAIEYDNDQKHQQAKRLQPSMNDLRVVGLGTESYQALLSAQEKGKSHPETVKAVLVMDRKHPGRGWIDCLRAWGVEGY